jgi:hypothetical protein
MAAFVTFKQLVLMIKEKYTVIFLSFFLTTSVRSKE